jgi:hypothetical protein
LTWFILNSTKYLKMAEFTKLQAILPQHKRLVNNSKFSDLTFVINKKTQVSAHSAVIQTRAPKLLGNQEKKKKSHLTVDLKDTIHEHILVEVLNYLYTDSVDLEPLKLTDVLLLCKAAKDFELPRLTWFVETHLKEVLNIETFFKLFKESSALKLERIVLLCLNFSRQNFNEISNHKSVKTDLGIELYQEVVSTHATGVEPFNIEPNPPPSTILQDFKTILDKIDELEGEFTLFQVGKEIKTFVPAHRAFLAVGSPELTALCSQSIVPKTKSAPEHLVVGKDAKPSSEDISGEAFMTLLKYLYYGETNVNANYTAELIAFCGDFKLFDYQAICFKNASTGISNDNVITILASCYLPQVADSCRDSALDVREKALFFIADHIESIDIAKLSALDARIASDIVFSIQRKIRKDKGLEVKDLPSLSPQSQLRRGQSVLDATTEKDKKKKK